MSLIGQAYQDNAVLFTGTGTTIGVGNAINTTGYAALTFQLSGSTFSGVIVAEGSSDNINWSPLLVTNISDLSPSTQMLTVGNYLINVDTRYIRYNITNITGTVNIIIVGNSTVSTRAVDKLALAMDEANNTPLNVKFQGGIKLDPQLATVLSDAPTEGKINLSLSASAIIDTTGYQSISFTTQALQASVLASNDGISWIAIAGYSLTLGTTASSSLSAGVNSLFPCYTKYIKLTAIVAGSVTYYLRSQPFNPSYAAAGTSVNISQINGSSAWTAGISGLLAVGGYNSPGTIPGFVNPVNVSGVDPAGLVRRLLTDTTGRLIVGHPVISANAAVGVTVPIQSLTSIVNQVPLNVQDTTQFEGQSQIELLSQILTELKIVNQQLYELPKLIATASQGASYATNVPPVQLGDEPAILRADPSLFNNQQ